MRMPGNTALLIIDVQRAIDDQGASTSLIYSRYEKTWMARHEPGHDGAPVRCNKSTSPTGKFHIRIAINWTSGRRTATIPVGFVRVQIRLRANGRTCDM